MTGVVKNLLGDWQPEASIGIRPYRENGVDYLVITRNRPSGSMIEQSDGLRVDALNTDKVVVHNPELTPAQRTAMFDVCIKTTQLHLYEQALHDLEQLMPAVMEFPDGTSFAVCKQHVQVLFKFLNQHIERWGSLQTRPHHDAPTFKVQVPEVGTDEDWQTRDASISPSGQGDSVTERERS